MSQFYLSSTTTSATTKTTHFSSLLLSDFLLFCSFILSHPLYFSYFIFFSPYLLKLLSFLSPLFITTSLLLLALLTVSPGLIDDDNPSQASESKVGFLLSAYRNVLNTLRSKLDDETFEQFRLFEELEACVVVFDMSSFKVGENPVEVSQIKCETDCLQAYDTQIVKCWGHGGLVGVPKEQEYNVEENGVEVALKKSETYSLQGFLNGIIESEASIHKVVKIPVETMSMESDKVGEKQSEPLTDTGSEAPTNVSLNNGGDYTSKATNVSLNNGGEYTSKATENLETLGSTLGTFGSMRKEKEWTRTLACKLYEERRNVDEGEGMDLLWEAYDDSSKMKVKNKEKKNKKNEIEYYDQDEEEEEMDEQFCCLQALRFSTRKMNLGMGRPNIMRISKALKGIGWFHQVSRHGKKGYN